MFKYQFISILFFIGFSVDSTAMERKKRKIPLEFQTVINSSTNNSSESRNSAESCNWSKLGDGFFGSLTPEESQEEVDLGDEFYGRSSPEQSQEKEAIAQNKRRKKLLDFMQEPFSTPSNSQNSEDEEAEEEEKSATEEFIDLSKPLVELVYTHPEQTIIDNLDSVNINYFNNKDEFGRTEIHLTTVFNQLNLLRTLWAYGAELDLPDNDGRTPLHIATEKNYKEIVQFLITNGANKNEQDKFGDSPFHLAVRSLNIEMIKFFLNIKADMYLKNANGETPYGLIIESGHAEFKKLVNN